MSSSQAQFRELIARHRAFLSQAETCIREDQAAAQNTEYSAFLSLLLRRIWAHHTSLQAAGQKKHNEKDAVRWGPIQVSREDRESAGILLTVQGPAAGDEHAILTVSEDDAQVKEARIQQYDKMSKALARAYSQELAISELGRPSIGQGNEQESLDTDQTRITLLKQYNDLRDVAQQLIGIVAENRGVPVRSLYSDAAYGVGPDD